MLVPPSLPFPPFLCRMPFLARPSQIILACRVINIAIVLWVLPLSCQDVLNLVLIAVLQFSFTQIMLQYKWQYFLEIDQFRIFISLAVRLAFSLHLPVGLLETLLPYLQLKIEFYAVTNFVPVVWCSA